MPGGDPCPACGRHIDEDAPLTRRQRRGRLVSLAATAAMGLLAGVGAAFVVFG